MKPYEENEKFIKLKDIFREMGSTLVAYSGGVDSTLLLAIASLTLKENVIAVTAVSPIRSEKDLENSKLMAGRLGVKHIIIESDDLEDENIRNNAVERCYFCKKNIFRKLFSLADEHSLSAVCEGSNVDDANEYRPGEKAVEELGARSPLKEAGFTREEIRAFSKEMGLETWNAPSRSCLLTRFPYGEKIGLEKLDKVKKAESLLEDLGFNQVRVRAYGKLTRIEVPHGQIKNIFDGRISEEIVNKFKALGYNYVTVDLEGYRSGSMDEKVKICHPGIPRNGISGIT